MAIFSFALFSCAGTGGTTADTDRDRDQTAMGTENRGEPAGMEGDQTTTGTGMETDQTTDTGMEGDQTTTGTGMEGNQTTDTGMEGNQTTDTGMEGNQTTGTDGNGNMTQDRELLSAEPVNYDEIFDDIDNTEQYDVLELARMDENLSVFVDLIEQAGLEASFEHLDNMESVEGVTIFMPTNQAFQDMSVERYEFLTDPENSNELRKVMQAHILPSEVPSIAFESNQRITTADGDEIDVTTEAQGTAISIGGAQIMRSDIEASNGIIHIVDAVIDPTATAPTGPYGE